MRYPPTVYLGRDGAPLRHYLEVDKGKLGKNKAILCRESASIEPALFGTGLKDLEKHSYEKVRLSLSSMRRKCFCACPLAFKDGRIKEQASEALGFPQRLGRFKTRYEKLWKCLNQEVSFSTRSLPRYLTQSVDTCGRAKNLRQSGGE